MTKPEKPNEDEVTSALLWYSSINGVTAAAKYGKTLAQQVCWQESQIEQLKEDQAALFDMIRLSVGASKAWTGPAEKFLEIF